MNWFFKSNGEGKPPIILGGSELPEKYGAIYLGDESEKRIYLTFDAGYSNENLERILDILKEENVKGAFFILPGIIKHSKDIVKRMADEGHTVCNHTTHHINLASINDIEKFKAEMTGIEDYYREQIGGELSKFVRPPEGKFSEKTLEFCQELGYTPVFWSFAYADWDNSNQPRAEFAKNKIITAAHNGMVILLHPTSKTNAEILSPVIRELKSRGYSFGTLDEFL